MTGPEATGASGPGGWLLPLRIFPAMIHMPTDTDSTDTGCSRASRRCAVVAVLAAVFMLPLPSRVSAETDAGSYTVKKHDTLWDLAFQFLGDPFKWPGIWDLNRTIENPHLIYPGDALTIPGMQGRTRGGRMSEGIEESTQEQTARWADRQARFQELTSGLLAESDESGQYVTESRDVDAFPGLGAVDADIWGPRIFWSTEFLGKIAFLWTAEDEKGLIAPGNAYVIGSRDKEIFHQFDRLKIKAFGDGGYSVGDTVDIFRQERFIKYGDKSANLVRRVARARMVVATGKDLEALLFKAWDVVRAKDRVAPATRFRRYEIDTVVAATQRIDGTVLSRVELTTTPHLYQSLIIDKGSQHGVRLGDIFTVHPVEDKQEPRREPALLGCAVHTGEGTSTLVIVRMFDNVLAVHDAVRLCKRMSLN